MKSFVVGVRNVKKNISKISLWILIFSILSLVTVAMVWSPRKELKIRGNADNLLERYDTSDIIEYSGLYINQVVKFVLME